VTGIAWNFDSSLVASSDLSGLVKIWNVDTKKCVFECDEGEVEYCQFHPKAKTYILTALAGGTMYFYNIKDGNFKILSGPVGVRCVAGEFLADGTQYLIAYEVSYCQLISKKILETS
jgi:WD40 repeat protein